MSRRPAAVVAVADGSQAVLRPLASGQMRIDGGMWAERQRINREVTIPLGAQQLERAGNYENLRLAAGTGTGTYSGLPLPFLDSDVYKWLEAVSWELGHGPSPELEREADHAIGLVAAAQADDGYLDSYYQVLKPDLRYVELPMGHELYCAGHLIQAAVAHARVTGRTDLLDIATRVVDNIDAAIGPNGRPGVCGHPEIEMALVELYRLTGEERHLALARCFLDRRGHGLLGPGPYGPAYYQDVEPVRESRTVAGHAVRALYLASGVVDAYLETGERALLDASVAQWEDMVARRTYLTGGVGSRHRDESFGDPYELPPDRAYCETCAAIASIMWSWRLLLATGEARYADLIERTLYNGFLSGLALDGRSFFYVNPLQLRASHQQPWNNRGSAIRESWYKCACCPPNVMRLIASLDQYVATADGRGVQLHQHVPGTVRAQLDGDGAAVELRVATGYPWSGRVEVTVEAAGAGEWSLALRVPGWCRGASLSAGGEERRDLPAGSYATVTRRWTPGDRVVLELPIAARLTEPHPRVDSVRGCLAIERGPLVYCLEQADLPAGVQLDEVALAGGDLTEELDPDLLGGVVAVRAEGVRGNRGEWDGWPYREPRGAAPDGGGERVALVAIPYFAWANRAPGPMRVWVPDATAASS